ncbi:hypothetical protein MTR_5g076525 [Medicago truncatula]|uniref:Uncharacterized protein n=1 Tax=Medicago truncatula TaxID=3880 RepID=A0A072UEM5_MEDTR|nr:hypothetical protein MTR_5g076525 [Medicago truncatula]
MTLYTSRQNNTRTIVKSLILLKLSISYDLSVIRLTALGCCNRQGSNRPQVAYWQRIYIVRALGSFPRQKSSPSH